MLLTIIENLINSVENNEDIYNMEFLSREYLEMHHLKCEKCQKYRVECAFSPHCTDRKHLNILIQLNTPINQRIFPAYCYSLYIKNISDFLAKKETLTSPNDSWLYLEEYLDFYKKELGKIKDKDYRKMFEKLINVWIKEKKTIILEEKYENKNQFTFIFNDTVYRMNFSKNIIIIDVNRRLCHSNEELENYLEILSRYYELKPNFELIKDTKTIWYLKFKFKTRSKIENEDFLSKFSDYYNLYEENDDTIIIVDLKTSFYGYSDRKIQNYKNLRKIFEIMNHNIRKT
ncbi:MAG: hypothetical protein EAX96_20280 [Candidatus Lokiarchaeota archaeon]|nr:hypothetical protein [Candidatus Lokiarchaeota archaeon]